MVSEKDKVFSEPPKWLPGFIARQVKHLTYNEWHSLLLGIIGVPEAFLFIKGFEILVVVSFAVLFTLIFVVGKYVSLPKAGKLVTAEPWYFLTSFVAWFFSSYIVIEAVNNFL